MIFDGDNMFGKSELYKKINPGFSLKDACNEPAYIYQPTPEGIQVLCDHYSNKYSIDLRCIDLRNRIDQSNDIRYYFNYLKENITIFDIDENKAIGLVLNFEHNHAVPVIISKKNDIKYMVVFDSISGGSIPGYYRIAALFPDYTFCLNAGTRQKDHGSCMTDAICILKEALQIECLIDLIQSRITTETLPIQNTNEGYRSPFFKPVCPNNFKLFKMPDTLLLTAQTSKYHEGCNLGTVLRDGNTLDYHFQHYTRTVQWANDEDRPSTPINAYLYLKAVEHKLLLDDYLNYSTEIESHEKYNFMSISAPVTSAEVCQRTFSL